MTQPTSVPSETLLAQLQWRYATKKFDPARKISAADWQTLERALVLSPSSYGLQPYRFYVIDDPAVREKLSVAARGQRQPLDASHYVVFARRLIVTEAEVVDFINRVSEVRGISPDSLAQYRNIIIGDIVHGPRGAIIQEWTARQTYLALGIFLNIAAQLGIDACPMEGFVPAQFDEILGLKAQGYGAVASAAVGYRSPEDQYAHYAKFRYPQEHLIHHV